MDLKKIIREEINDIKWVEDVKPKPTDEIDWIREIPAAFELKQDQNYVIDCCETGYNEDSFLNKFIELFGDIPPYNKYVIGGTSPPSILVNWFNNQYIKNDDHRVNLLLKLTNNRHELGGWLPCERDTINGWTWDSLGVTVGMVTYSQTITPQDFLNGVIDWDNEIQH